MIYLLMFAGILTGLRFVNKYASDNNKGDEQTSVFPYSTHPVCTLMDDSVKVPWQTSGIKAQFIKERKMSYCLLTYLNDIVLK